MSRPPDELDETPPTPPPGRGCSLWLLLDAADAAHWRARIRQLAARLGTEPFEPHVTLLAGLPRDAPSLDGPTRALAAALAPFPARVAAAAHHPGWYRCGVLELVPDPDLLAARGLAEGTVDHRPALRFEPHLSLVYGAVPASRALAALAAAAPPTGTPLRLLHPRLRLVSTDGPPGDWFPVCEHPLGPGPP